MTHDPHSLDTNGEDGAGEEGSEKMRPNPIKSNWASNLQY
jgi:hypothetical protein